MTIKKGNVKLRFNRDPRYHYNYYSDTYYDGLIEELVMMETDREASRNNLKYEYLSILYVQKWNYNKIVDALKCNGYKIKRKYGGLEVRLQNGVKVLFVKSKCNYCMCNIKGKKHRMAAHWGYVWAGKKWKRF